jgi:hypothetical protein
MVVELVERPLPKPSDEDYIEARLLEALAEARLTLEWGGASPATPPPGWLSTPGKPF